MINTPTIASLIGAMFGNSADQAAIGRGINQVLLILLGAGLVITGIVFVVSGSKSGQVIVETASGVASKAAALAA